MNQLPQMVSYFTYEEKEVRTVVRNGEVWFVAKDVCDVLDISDARKAVQRLDEDERSLIPVTDSLGRKQETFIVNEAGLYTLILGSRKPEAKAFKRWVTHEVLPSIRKTGVYDARIPKTFAEALRLAAELEEEKERLLLENQQMKPKAEAHDRFISGENLQTMSQVAKALGTGRNRLFEFLRQKKILMSNNMPYQQYIDRGYFQVKETPKKLGDKHINFTQTYVTAKGVDFIFRLLQEQTA